MKKNLLSAAAIAVFGLLFSILTFAQDDQTVSAAGNMYVISAKAGGVNFVEGNVTIVRKNGKSGLLLKSDTVEIGDKVVTGANGKAEILLNPGSFVRLGANTGFEFQSVDLDNLRLKLNAGSAIFEVYADNEFKVTLDLPDAAIELTKSGVFRVNVLANGAGQVFVWKGKLFVGDEKAEVKAGRSVIIKGKATAIAKFDRDNKDDFDIWSDARAKEAVAINKRLQRNALTNALLSSYNIGGWNIFGTFGLWVFDPFTGRWCFLPFGQGWRSPYGWGYGFNIYYCSLPPYVYTSSGGGTTTTNTNPNNMTPQQAQIREERRVSMQTPTFQRFENNQRETRGGGGGSGNSSSSSSQSDSSSSRSRRDDRTFEPSAPTYNPPTYSPPTKSDPPPSPPPAPRSDSGTTKKDN